VGSDFNLNFVVKYFLKVIFLSYVWIKKGWKMLPLSNFQHSQSELIIFDFKTLFELLFS